MGEADQEAIFWQIESLCQFTQLTRSLPQLYSVKAASQKPTLSSIVYTMNGKSHIVLHLMFWSILLNIKYAQVWLIPNTSMVRKFYHSLLQILSPPCIFCIDSQLNFPQFPLLIIASLSLIKDQLSFKRTSITLIYQKLFQASKRRIPAF